MLKIIKGIVTEEMIKETDNEIFDELLRLQGNYGKKEIKIVNITKKILLKKINSRVKEIEDENCKVWKKYTNLITYLEIGLKGVKDE